MRPVSNLQSPTATILPFPEGSYCSLIRLPVHFYTLLLLLIEQYKNGHVEDRGEDRGDEKLKSKRFD